MYNITPEFISGTCNGISQAIIGHPLDTIKVLQQNNKSWNKLKFIDLMRGVKYPIYYKIVTKSLCFDLNNKFKIKNDFARNAIIGLYLAPFTHFIDLFKICRQNGNSVKKLSYHDFINYRGFICTISRDMVSYSLYIPVYVSLKKKNYNTIISGGLAGLVNWTASYPLDVIRTRQITHNKNTLSQSFNMGSIWKGYKACALRAILTSATGFGVYEGVLNLITNYN